MSYATGFSSVTYEMGHFFNIRQWKIQEMDIGMNKGWFILNISKSM